MSRGDNEPQPQAAQTDRPALVARYSPAESEAVEISATISNPIRPVGKEAGEAQGKPVFTASSAPIPADTSTAGTGDRRASPPDGASVVTFSSPDHDHTPGDAA